MTLAPETRSRRGGFTLIELLVVIAIIVILIGLVGAAVVKVLGKPVDMQNRKDIDDLHSAVEEFNQIYGVYPPSKILLSNDPDQYDPTKGTATALGLQSAIYLQKIWKKLDLKQSHDWSGGTMPAGKWTVVLEGDQCLVFFLGGIPSANPPGCRGFADSASMPTNLSLPNKAKRLFNFASERLFRRSNHSFYSYRDPYSFDDAAPYAYFAVKSKAKNSYDENDCAGLGVKPYYEKVSPFRQYLNPESFQIISAGPDKTFGAATGTGGVFYPSDPKVSAAAQDDTSNFHSQTLGNPG